MQFLKKFLKNWMSSWVVHEFDPMVTLFHQSVIQQLASKPLSEFKKGANVRIDQS